MRTETNTRKYDAFISYSGSRSIPRSIVFRLSLIGVLFWRVSGSRLRIFFDRREMLVGDPLSERISKAIRNSRYFILFASKAAAQSPWVSRETEFWLQTHPASRILIVVVDGTIKWDHENNDFNWNLTDCLPAILKGRFSHECCWEDFRQAPLGPSKKQRLRDVVASLAARLLDVPKEKVLSDERARQRRLQVSAAAAVMAVLILSVIAYSSWRKIETRANALYEEAVFKLIGRRDSNDIDVAQKKLEQALEEDPHHAPSWIALADTHILLIGFGSSNDREMHLRKAGEALARAREYGGENTSEYCRVRGRFLIYNDRKLIEARELLTRAVDVDSRNVDALYALASTYTFLDEHDAAIRLVQQAVSIIHASYGTNDDRFTHAQVQLAWTYLYAGKLDAAIRLSNEILRRGTNPAASRFLAHAYSVIGDTRAAIISYHMAINQVPSEPQGVLRNHREPNLYPNYLCALVKSGQMQVSDAVLELETLQEQVKQVSPYRLAQGHACLGETARALEQLKRARESRDIFVVWARVDPLLFNLRELPEFREYLSSIGLLAVSPEHVAAKD